MVVVNLSALSISPLNQYPAAAAAAAAAAAVAAAAEDHDRSELGDDRVSSTVG